MPLLSFSVASTEGLCLSFSVATHELRCTALGGLSITPTSLAIEARLTARKAACGAGTCGCG
jgi:hypothetical protein